MAASWRTALIKKIKKKAIYSCVQDVDRVLKEFENLNPGLQDFTYDNGVKKELFSLEGTIPAKFTGVTYNIPVCVLLQEGHPDVSPLVYVRPTNTMVIRESKHVDTCGRVYHPYLHKWNYKTCNIVAFLRILCDVFGNSPPVYSKPPEQSPPPRSVHQQAPSTSTDYLPRLAHQQTQFTTSMYQAHSKPPEQSPPPRSVQRQAPSTSADYLPSSAHQQTPSTSANHPPRATQQQPDQEQQKECIVCMDNPRNSVLIPCGHLGVCMECAKQLQRTTKICPVCRRPITECHQVYDS